MKNTIDVRVAATDINGSGVREIWIYRDGELIEKKPADENGDAEFALDVKTELSGIRSAD